MKLRQGYLLPIIACSLLFASCTNNEPLENHSKAAAPAHWDYTNTDWAGEGYSECGGMIQSPINIATASTIKTVLPDVKFNYSDFPISIIDNGHSIQVNPNANGTKNTITYNGNVYELKQFHFHAAAEHRIDRVQPPMELHLVHKNEQSGAIVVIGLLIEEGPTDNPFIDKVWKNIPQEKGKEVATTDNINMNDILPASKLYYTYTGSLTIPPCSQGLNWIVMKEKIKLSAAQIHKFTAIYSNNTRVVQPLNNRLVYEDIEPVVKKK